MSEDVILAAIRLDTLSVAASSVYAEDPTHYINVNAVPRHITTCLAEMVTAYGTLTQLTSISRGDGKGATIGIIIEPSRSFESAGSGEEIMCNTEPGATKSAVKIVVKGIRTSTDVTLARDIGYRLRYILDNDIRAIEGNTYMAQRTYQDMLTDSDITVLNPLTSASGYFKMLWVRSDELTVGEWNHVFVTEYIINFG